MKVRLKYLLESLASRLPSRINSVLRIWVIWVERASDGIPQFRVISLFEATDEVSKTALCCIEGQAQL